MYREGRGGEGRGGEGIMLREMCSCTVYQGNIHYPSQADRWVLGNTKVS